MSYLIEIEEGHSNFEELLPLYAAHYAETQDRFRAQGIVQPALKIRKEQYDVAWKGGWLINYVARHEGEAVGVANVYVTNDMHNSAIIAREDTLYVKKDHRNGLGRKLVKFILDDLRKRSVGMVYIDAVTDLRVANAWRRMGFKDYAHRMCIDLKE